MSDAELMLYAGCLFSAMILLQVGFMWVATIDDRDYQRRAEREQQYFRDSALFHAQMNAYYRGEGPPASYELRCKLGLIDEEDEEDVARHKAAIEAGYKKWRQRLQQQTTLPVKVGQPLAPIRDGRPRQLANRGIGWGPAPSAVPDVVARAIANEMNEEDRLRTAKLVYSESALPMENNHD